MGPGDKHRDDIVGMIGGGVMAPQASPNLTVIPAFDGAKRSGRECGTMGPGDEHRDDTEGVASGGRINRPEKALRPEAQEINQSNVDFRVQSD
jgi:hypothetical protein